jgi:transposase
VQHVTRQGEALQALQARLAPNSRNRSKPPARDGAGQGTRTASFRQSGEKPHGGQPGHAGHPWSASDEPDRLELHGVEPWAHCQASWVGSTVAGYAERQGCALPTLRIAVTAHRAESKGCPAWGHPRRGRLPATVTPTGPYGPTGAPWASSGTNSHPLPGERTPEIVDDLGPHRVSEATGVQASEQWDTGMAPATAAVQEPGRAAAVLPVDASGRRGAGKLPGLQVASTDPGTPYEGHAQRGHEALEAGGMLGAFRGTAVHAPWTPSFR